MPQIKAGTANNRKKLVNPFIGKDPMNNVASSDAGKMLIIIPVGTCQQLNKLLLIPYF